MKGHEVSRPMTRTSSRPVPASAPPPPPIPPSPPGGSVRLRARGTLRAVYHDDPPITAPVVTFTPPPLPPPLDPAAQVRAEMSKWVEEIKPLMSENKKLKALLRFREAETKRIQAGF